MSEQSGEKTEEPTDKKIDDARKKGQVWESKDLSGVLSFIAALGILKVMWPTIQRGINELFAYSFDRLAHPIDLERFTFEMLQMALYSIIVLSLPIALAAGILGGMGTFLQTGPLFTMHPLKPNFEQLNPIQGLKNMFAKKQLVELLKSMVKILVTGYVVYGVVRGALDLVAGTIRGDAELTLEVLGELVYRICMRVGLLFTAFAIFDVWFQHKSFMKDMMMTKDEIKREYKESEGDPHHKHKRREMHMEIMESAQMDSVRKSDVVVTNPDHLAVALQYDRAKDPAPRVVCKGMNLRAEAMKELAKQSDVPILRNVPLAHALYRVDVGTDIPEELYDAVAEVLNFIYGLRQTTESS